MTKQKLPNFIDVTSMSCLQIAETAIGNYAIACIAGEWFWWVVRQTNQHKVDSYAAAVAACEKHFQENSNG